MDLNYRTIKMDIESTINEVLNYTPENERPDISAVIQFFNEKIAARKNGFTEADGRKWGPFFNPKLVQWVYDNWTPQKHDVIISTFSKTGTTWVRQIVNCLIIKDDDQIKNMVSKMTIYHLYLETGVAQKFEMLNKLPWKQKILSTHLPVELVNLEKIRSAGAKIICTLRNPQDTAVSFYHFSKVLRNTEENWEEFYEKFISGSLPTMLKIGEWLPDYWIGWYKHKDDENVLFVVYEDIKKNPRKEIRRIAGFLEVDLSDEELSKIVEVTSFQAMKVSSNAHYSRVKLFRKGEIGNWKNYFTVAQSERMDQKLKEKLSSVDISFIYD